MLFYKNIRRHIVKKLTRVTASNRGQFKHVPKNVLFLTYFLNVSVLMQGMADVALKLFGMAGIVPNLPWRTDFLSLTLISVVMGFRAFRGLRQHKFEVTRNSLELGLLVESALVIGDTEFIYRNMEVLPHIFMLRMPFIIFTSINILIILYSHYVLELRKWPHLRSGGS